jgi:hypothetical protein
MSMIVYDCHGLATAIPQLNAESSWFGIREKSQGAHINKNLIPAFRHNKSKIGIDADTNLY